MTKLLTILLAAFMPCMARAFVSNLYDTNTTSAVDAHVLSIVPGGTASNAQPPSITLTNLSSFTSTPLNLAGGTNLQANGISTSGGTPGQILLNTAAGTAWTNDQSIIQAGSYEFVTSITNPITGQITYTVSGVNTNQFLGAGPNGYRDASNVTNLNPMSISTNTIIFRNTNGVSGYLIQVTSIGGDRKSVV